MSGTNSNSFKIFILTAANGINFIINFLTLPYLARFLSYEDYGTYGQVLLIGTYLQIFFTFGIPQVLNVIYLENKERQGEVLNSVLVFNLLCGFVACLIMLVTERSIAHIFKNEAIGSLLVIYSLSVIGQVILTSLTTSLVFWEKVKAVSTLLLITNFLRIAFLFVSIHFFNSVTYVIVSIAFTTVLSVVLHYMAVPKQYRYSFRISRELLRSTLSISWPVFITNIMGVGILYVDGFIVSTMLTVKDYAIYRNGAIEPPFISTIYSSVAVVIFPTVIRLFKENEWEEMYRIKKKASSTIASLIYPIVIYAILTSKFFFNIYLSEKYASSAIIFSIYNLAVLLRISDYQDILITAKSSRRLLTTNIFCFVINLILNVVLIKIWGVAGSAIAFVTSLYILAFGQLFYTNTITGMPISKYFDFPRLLKLIIVSAGLALIVLVINNVFNNPYVYIVTSVVYFPFCYLLLIKMKLFEVDILQKILGKIPFGHVIIRYLKIPPKGDSLSTE